jgi:site-specific DNA recombinase
MHPAAIYCRSSKDRAEIGLDTQRKELKAFAKANDLRVVAEFSDMEISGSLDEVSRPGLRALLTAMAAPDREWHVLLVVDTSRIARDPMLAMFVQRECEKHGVELRYSKIAVNGKDAFGELLLGQLRQFDRFHSRLSAEKGRAGLETNISKGFRAGGAAPFGYKLQHEETGGTRGGVAVRKSRLVCDARAAKKVQAFLAKRAAGTPRHIAAKETGLADKAQASLIAIERNALTYAGFTVWNQRRKHKPTRDEPTKTMVWRPRAEWIITPKPTHEALITRAQAEQILERVEHNNPKPRGLDIRRPDQYLLTGLLHAPDGTPWQADGRFYRVGRKGQRVLRQAVDQFVLHQIAQEIRGKEFIAKVVQAAHDMAESIEDDPKTLQQAIRTVEGKLSRLADVVAETGNATLVAKLKELEAQRDKLLDDLAAAGDRAKVKAGMRGITAKHVEALLEFAPVPTDAGKPGADVSYTRRTLAALVRRVDFDPLARTTRVHYTVPLVSGAKLASPRGFEPRFSP